MEISRRMFMNDDLSDYREAFKTFVIKKFSWKFDRGDFDNLIRGFMEGDSLEINMKIETIPNDIIFMRALARKEITPEIEKKVRNLWEEESSN